jgi:hypothetical protein
MTSAMPKSAAMTTTLPQKEGSDVFEVSRSMMGSSMAPSQRWTQIKVSAVSSLSQGRVRHL